MKIAVVTPYFREPLKTIRRAHQSVRDQTHDCTHVLVADGCPQDAVDGWEAIHLRIAKCPDAVGNGPRSVGGLWARDNGFDGVAYLDADNCYETDHVERLVQLLQATGAGVAASGRLLCGHDGRVFGKDTKAHGHDYCDTNSYLVHRDAFELLDLWQNLPMAAGSDKLFFEAIQYRGISFAYHDQPTVQYLTRYAPDYLAAGITPPGDATRIDDIKTNRERWRRTAAHQRHRILLGLAGARMPDTAVEHLGIDLVDDGDPRHRTALARALKSEIPGRHDLRCLTAEDLIRELTGENVTPPSAAARVVVLMEHVLPAPVLSLDHWGTCLDYPVLVRDPGSGRRRCDSVLDACAWRILTADPELPGRYRRQNHAGAGHLRVAPDLAGQFLRLAGDIRDELLTHREADPPPP